MAGEGKLWDRVRGRLAKDFFVQRIESVVGDGVPDVHLTSRINGRQHWVELKHVPVIPVRATTRVFGTNGLRPEQVAWLWCRGEPRVMASVWILAQADDYFFLVHGAWAREFNGWCLDELKRRAAWLHRGRLTDAAWMRLTVVLSADAGPGYWDIPYMG